MLTSSAIEVLRARTIDLTAAIAAPALLSRVAEDFILMIQSYESDCRYFIQAGDRINALASAAYALGWLDAGVSLGLLQEGICRGPEIFTLPDVPVQSDERMEEKTVRYERLLESAVRGVSPAPEPGTHPCESAWRFQAAARLYLGYGRLFYRENARENALFCYSYGFSWLDAGIRAGLFRVTGNRELYAH